MSTRISLTNQEARDMARTMVGDGLTPNRYFVTRSSYYFENPQDEEMSEMPTHYEPETKVFLTLEAALEEYDDIKLSLKYGIGCAMIEDRKQGTLREKFLRPVISYEETECY